MISIYNKLNIYNNKYNINFADDELIDIEKRFRNNIYKMRKKQGLDQRAFSRKTKINYESTVGIENGNINPSLKTIIKLLYFNGIDINDLFI